MKWSNLRMVCGPSTDPGLVAMCSAKPSSLLTAMLSNDDRALLFCDASIRSI